MSATFLKPEIVTVFVKNSLTLTSFVVLFPTLPDKSTDISDLPAGEGVALPIKNLYPELSIPFGTSI